MVNLEDWKKALQSELKLADPSQLESKLSKKTIEGVYSILSVEAAGQVIPNSTPWKKSSQTYVQPSSTFLESIRDDLGHGVRVFFLNARTLGVEICTQAIRLIEAHDDAKDMQVVMTGASVSVQTTLQVIDESKGVVAHDVINGGGTHLQELAALTVAIIRWAEKNPTATQMVAMVSTDEHYFQSIAKIRALREIAERIFSEFKRTVSVQVVSIVNVRGWTLYDRYNNMLRNTASVGAALVGGADVIQTLGYMAPFENEIEAVEDDAEQKIHVERARRMARNTTHILSLESMLGMVQDAAAGSYHFETLTENFASDAWALMQKWIGLSEVEYQAQWSAELQKVQTERLKQFNTRRLVLSGINDFPNVKEKLALKKPLKKEGFRLARAFEELRLRVERLKPSQRRDVRIVFWGDYAALNARLNFTKNYFELLGLTVHDPLASVQDEAALKAWLAQSKAGEIEVLCAKDEDYAALVTQVASKPLAKFVAGKVDVTGYEAIFGGQDVYDVLSRLVAQMEASS